MYCFYKQDILIYIILQITLGLTRAANIQNEIALGLLYLTCLPGGGLGHLIVAITNQTDLELSIAINAFEMLLPIGKCKIIVSAE